MDEKIDPIMLAFLEGKNALKHAAQHLYHTDDCEYLYKSLVEVIKNVCDIEDIYASLLYKGGIDGEG